MNIGNDMAPHSNIQAPLGQGPNLPEGAGISAQARSHILERRVLLTAHPEIRALAGPDARGAYYALLILAVHWSSLWLFSQSNLFVVFLGAFFFGQVVIHSAGALVHETAHRLVFREPKRKLAFDLLLEVITTSFGRQLTYQYEHVTSHHPYMGNYERDYEHEDMCRFLARRSFRARHPKAQRLLTLAELAVHLLPLGFLIAEKIFSRLYRTLTGKATRDRERNIGAASAPRAEQNVFIAVSIVTNIFLFAAFGFLGWLYHIWSLSLFLSKCGITNLGQSLSEHPGDDDEHPTRSTYWWGNKILFNTGYHHEHHTFPNIAWSRLPAVKAIAPRAFIDGGKSYPRCWWDHVSEDFNPSRRNATQKLVNPPRCALEGQA
jgi:sphingolipid delta-4 desaturase